MKAEKRKKRISSEVGRADLSAFFSCNCTWCVLFYCFYVLYRIFLPYYCSNGHLSVQEFLPWCSSSMGEINWNWSIGKQSGKSVEYIVTKESRNIRLWVVCGAGSMKRYGECPSVCLVCLLQQRAAGLLLWALLARNIDRLLRPLRAVPRCQRS